MPYLVEASGARHELRPGATVVGSGAGAAWRLERSGLASRHFVVELRGDRATVAPVAAHDVVAINGEQTTMEPHVLHEGDEIRAGDACFRYGASPVPPPPREEEPAFLVHERRGRAYALTGRSARIGRAATSVVQISEPSVSRVHAELRPEAGGHALYAMGSAGTRVNDARVSAPLLLAPGDRIQIGEAVLLYHRGSPPPGVVVVSRDTPPDPEVAERATVQVGEVRAVPRGSRSLALPIAIAALVLLAIALIGMLL